MQSNWSSFCQAVISLCLEVKTNKSWDHNSAVTSHCFIWVINPETSIQRLRDSTLRQKTLPQLLLNCQISNLTSFLLSWRFNYQNYLSRGPVVSYSVLTNSRNYSFLALIFICGINAIWRLELPDGKSHCFAGVQKERSCLIPGMTRHWWEQDTISLCLLNVSNYFHCLSGLTGESHISVIQLSLLHEVWGWEVVLLKALD